MKKILLLLGLLFSSIYAESFSESKKILKNIYKDNQTTFYCGCKYDPSNKDNYHI